MGILRGERATAEREKKTPKEWEGGQTSVEKGPGGFEGGGPRLPLTKVLSANSASLGGPPLRTAESRLWATSAAATQTFQCTPSDARALTQREGAISRIPSGSDVWIAAWVFFRLDSGRICQPKAIETHKHR